MDENFDLRRESGTVLLRTNYRRLCWTVRGVVVLNWLAIALVLSMAKVPKTVAMSAFAVFRICALCALPYLIYESSLLTNKRTTVSGMIVDAVLVLPVFLFRFVVRAATF